MARLYTPREFADLKTEALKMGFRHVESGPLVRSSYHAHEQAASAGPSASPAAPEQPVETGKLSVGKSA